MNDTQVTIQINPALWRQFRADCILMDERASVRLVKLITEDVASRKKDSSDQALTKE